MQQVLVQRELLLQQVWGSRTFSSSRLVLLGMRLGVQLLRACQQQVQEVLLLLSQQQLLRDASQCWLLLLG